jgi:hypothetical protein
MTTKADKPQNLAETWEAWRRGCAEDKLRVPPPAMSADFRVGAYSAMGLLGDATGWVHSGALSDAITRLARELAAAGEADDLARPMRSSAAGRWGKFAA